MENKLLQTIKKAIISYSKTFLNDHEKMELY